MGIHGAALLPRSRRGGFLSGENRTQREVQACEPATKVGDMKMSDDEFEQAIEDALAGIPDRFKQVLENVGIAMAQEPNAGVGARCATRAANCWGCTKKSPYAANHGLQRCDAGRDHYFQGRTSGMRYARKWSTDPQDRAARDRPLLRLR